VKTLQHIALDIIENEAKTTRRVIEAIPADRSHYKPDPISKSALQLARHIAVSELHFLRSIRAGKFDYKYAMPEALKTPAEIAAWYAEEIEKAAAELRSMSPEELGKTMEFLGTMEMPAVLYLNLAVHHSIHHRGQLTAYIRPMGGRVPSIYGPSYEDDQAEKATA
jgi:uncharacterized damage-inducible protein DinB